MNHGRRQVISRACLLGFVALSSAIAAAQAKPAAQLVYEHPPGLVGCPDERELRDAVAGRLGYDPFALPSTRLVAAKIVDDASGLHAEIELRGNDGRIAGTRKLSVARHDCRELGSAMELAISVAIDPMVLSRPTPPPPPAVPPMPVVPSPARSVPHHDRIGIRAGAGVLGHLGAGPTIGAGFNALVGLRWRLASFNLEGRADLPTTATIAGGAGVRGSVFLASFVPCAHYRFLMGCGVASVGALHGEGIHVDVPQSQTTLYAAAGARIGAEVHIVRELFFQAHFDVLGTITPTTLSVNGVRAWTSPPVSGALGIGLLGDFL